ncbi:MAG TPA: hypothetical protein VF181_06910 [Balneolaceae bacterium]
MRKAQTYRFLSAFIALALIGSISLPACLYANGQMDFCHKEMQQHETKASNAMPAGHCEMPASSEQGEASHHQKSDTGNATNCDYSFTCANVQDTSKAETVPTILKAKVLLSAAVLDFTVELQPVQTPREVPAPNLNSTPPPVFLVNSSFLN